MILDGLDIWESRLLLFATVFGLAAVQRLGTLRRKWRTATNNYQDTCHKQSKSSF